MSLLRLAALACWCSLLLAAPGRAATFLFDATKAESAGNANWVIDEDSNVAARYPTPAASGITASTPETYWTGALSSWGVALVQLGHSVEQLPVGGRITYQDSTNAQDLSKYQVYVVCEPNILFTTAEKNALARYVQSGGSLFVISDHVGSDRNNDGYDSVAIWNDFFSNNGVLTNPFGVTINSTSVSLTSTYADTAADDIMTNGTLGAVTQLKYSSGATMTLNPVANASVRAAFWADAAHSASNVMAAYGTFGAGRFAVLCDSSPPDDGTGSSGHTLYYGWTELGVNHSRLILNASVWLAAGGSSVPYNDNFANAAPFGPGATYVTGYNIGATRETGEPTHANVTGYTSVWWQFTAANGGTATFTTTGSNFDTLLAVYTGSAVNALTQIAANDNFGAVLQSFVSFPVTAGTTYRVAVDGKTGANGQIILNPKLPGPANDSFASATAISYSGTTLTLTGNNYNATFETNEPTHANVSGGHSVWWRWTPTTSGPVTISTAGSDFDTSLAVYTGTAVGALTTVASNSNYGSSLQSSLSFNAVAGTTYRLAVDGNGDAMGNVVLALTPGGVTDAPANDGFVNAAPVSATNVVMPAVATASATKETGEPNHGYSAGGHSVWYRWTAVGDGTLTLTTAGSDFDTTLGLYTGPAVNALTSVAQNDDVSTSVKTSKLTVPVSGDTVYSVGVDGSGSATGSAVPNLAFTPVAATVPANDNFASARVFTGMTTQYVNAYNTYATVEANEPAPVPPGGHSLWWRWTAPAAAVVEFSTIGSSYNPLLEAFTGTAVNNLKLIGSTETPNYLLFNAQAGTTYYGRTSASSGGQTGYVAFYFYPSTAPVVTLTATTASITEKDQTASTLSVSLDSYSQLGVSIPVKLTGTATPNVDYFTDPPTVDGVAYINVPSGTYGGSLTFYALPDNDPAEGDETIIATAQTGAGYTVNAPLAAKTITIRDDSPYTSAWTGTYRPLGFSGASAAPAADPDGDGVSNLLEFAFNGNPLAADAAGILPVAGSGSFADATGATARYATLTFTRRTDAPNLTYAVESTDNPATGAWTGGGTAFVSASALGMPANTERAVYRAASPLDSTGRQFFRVRVTATL